MHNFFTFATTLKGELEILMVLILLMSTVI